MSRAGWCVAFVLGSAGAILAQASRPTGEPRTIPQNVSREAAIRDAAARQVAAPPAGAAARAEYRKRAGALDGGSAEDLAARRLELALWCEQQGLQAEMRTEAEKALAGDPASPGAHRLLEHEQVDGKWLTREAALRARGYVQYRGQWMRKYDVAVLQYREEQARERAQLERELNECLARLASSSPTTRAKALAQLEARSEGLCWPELAVFARKHKAVYDAAWHEYEVTASVRLQDSRLLSLEPYATSLGVGTPVRLQLPRLQTTSLSTTVVLPAGSGR